MPFGPANRSSTQPGSAKPLYPQWADRLHNKNCAGTWPSKGENGMSRYQQFIWALTNDDRFQRDVTLGKRIALYKFRGELGVGNFSRVKLAFHQLAHERVAVKIMDKSAMDQKALRMLSREVAALELVRHPSIVRLYEVVETLSKVYLVMEVAPCGEMYTRISNEGKYGESQAQLLFSQLVSAVDYLSLRTITHEVFKDHVERILDGKLLICTGISCHGDKPWLEFCPRIIHEGALDLKSPYRRDHSLGLYHRDIKAENIFLATPTQLKLGDFGFATMQQENQQNFLTTFCGSPPYAAPELFQDDSYSGAHVDVWAVGIVLFFMVTATMPFQAQTVAGLKQCILDGTYAIPTYLSLSCRQLITAILRRKPEERLTIDQIKNSPWLQNQQFAEPLSDNEFLPSLDTQFSEAEETVRSRLEEYGITRQMLADHVNKGGRSPVIGTYRILMHRHLQDIAANSRKTAAVLSSSSDIDDTGEGKSKEERENTNWFKTINPRQKSKPKFRQKLTSCLISSKGDAKMTHSKSCVIL